MYFFLFFSLSVVDIAALCLKKTSVGHIVSAVQMTRYWQLYVEQDARSSMVQPESRRR